MPISAKEKSCLKMVLRLCDSRPVKTIGAPCALDSSIVVCDVSSPRGTWPAPDEPPFSSATDSSGPTLRSRLVPWNSMANAWPLVRY